MKRSPLLATIFLLITTNGFAEPKIIVGTYLEKTENPKNVCLVYGANKKAIYGCTATLTADDQILTARHCISHKGDYLIGCGYKGINAKGTPEFTSQAKINKIKYVPGAATAKAEENSGSDFAIFTLKEKLPITPMETVKDEKDLAKIFEKDPLTGDLVLKSDANCRIAGYGTNNSDKKDFSLNTAKLDTSTSKVFININTYDTTGAATIDQISNEDYEKMTTKTLDKTNVTGLAKTNHTDHGDSGGPLYCMIDGKWQIIGVASTSGQMASWAMAGTPLFNVYKKFISLNRKDQKHVLRALRSAENEAARINDAVVKPIIGKVKNLPDDMGKSKGAK